MVYLFKFYCIYWFPIQWWHKTHRSCENDRSTKHIIRHIKDWVGYPVFSHVKYSTRFFIYSYIHYLMSRKIWPTTPPIERYIITRSTSLPTQAVKAWPINHHFRWHWPDLHRRVKISQSNIGSYSNQSGFKLLCVSSINYQVCCCWVFISITTDWSYWYFIPAVSSAAIPAILAAAVCIGNVGIGRILLAVVVSVVLVAGILAVLVVAMTTLHWYWRQRYRPYLLLAADTVSLALCLS